MSTKEFKKCYFVIYDKDEYIIAYLDDYTEINKFTNLRLCDIAKRYKNGYLFNFNGTFYLLKAFK